MNKEILMIRYENRLYKFNLPTNNPKSITIGNETSNTITINQLPDTVELTWEPKKRVWMREEKIISINEVVTITLSNNKDMNLYIACIDKASTYDITTNYTVTLSGKEYDDIVIEGTEVDALFVREKLTDSFTLHVNKGYVYHNYRRVEKETVICSGDVVIIDGVILTVKDKELFTQSSEKRLKTKLSPLAKSDYSYSESYPDYHRSPRIIYREPVEKMTIAKPSNLPTKPNEHLIRTIVPPIVMILVTILIFLIRPFGFYIIASVAITLVTIVISITTYFGNAKEYKQAIAERDSSYRAYLKNKTMELYSTVEKQRNALLYHYPHIAEIRDMATTIHSRIYEKTRLHHDFLMYRVGMGNVDTSFEIQFNEEEFSQQKDELIEIARDLRTQFLSLQDVPITTSLMKGPVGYIGQRSIVINQLQLLVMQTALFHSYHDVQFITIFPEEEKQRWEWMRWLPHASVRDINVRGFVYHERSRDQVLNSLYQILKERRMAVEEKGNSKEKIYFSPHYVVLITDEKLILDHIVMEFFNEDPSELGVSLIFVQDVMQSLPEHVKTVIDIRDSKSGNIILEEGELVNKEFSIDAFPVGLQKEDISRALAPLNHLQNLKNSIPESVTFLGLYGVEKVEELHVGTRWAKNATHKTLAVPLGLRGKEDIVNLNLHEKAHGPHGLIAGTTGSGKSEIIQSYILSLAVNFHPHEVAFLLIDYKGGGMANLFKNLPHLLGAITNLDGAQSMRALASIKAELKKRQRLFSEYDVNHINQYHKLYKEEKVQEAMPHLFLISDEFAELKAEQPDFMKELVSTARIGRSLGIHLILATQKPSGVVDDQIWSNSKFKLALKVQNTSDSNEILKTPDAAEIKLPGRAYLQVGNNEIYELFQSAWSGADYVEDKDEQSHLDATIYAINDLGQYEVISEDLSGLSNTSDVTSVPTQLDAVIDYLHKHVEERQIAALPRPWLPPLPEKLFLPELHPINYKEAWYKKKKPLLATVGLLDQPELQAQSPITLDLTKNGHIAIFSSPGYGKSTFLQSMIMDLVRQHSPEHLHVYLLDFGTNGLLPLKGLPHVSDTIRIDEVEKAQKFIRRLEEEVRVRRRLLSEYGVANLEMYESASGVTLPNIILAIDNYDAVKEAEFAEPFERFIAQIAREGSSLGIFLLVSAGRQLSLRIQVSSNIKTQLTLYLIDQSEIHGIVGRTSLTIEDIQGRGLIKDEEVTLTQIALPTLSETTLEQIEALSREANEMRESWTGELPDPIPVMPEVLTFEDFKQRNSTKQLVAQNILPLGLDYERVESVGFDLSKQKHLLLMSNNVSFLKEIKKGIVQNVTLLSNTYQAMVLDVESQPLVDCSKNVNSYISKQGSLSTIIKSLMEEIKLREELKTNGTLHEHKGWIIYISDLSDFIYNTLITIEQLKELMTKGPALNMFFIFTAEQNAIEFGSDELKRYVRSQVQDGIVAMRMGDQSLFKVPYISGEKMLGQNESYVYIENQLLKIRVPKL
jgi:DNA segregation ATPase FtsK/SpoIIIE, S-DNA-T family